MSAFAALTCQNIQAADPGLDDSMAEVLVTAQHRVQNSQDIGASVNAISASRLDEAGLHSGRDIVDLLSGVQAANAYGSQPVFQIRGVGASDFQVSTSPSAGVYRDGVFLSTNVQAGTQMFDLERVEVLKGPRVPCTVATPPQARSTTSLVLPSRRSVGT